MKNSTRAGFTLAELLVAVVLGTIVTGSALEVLVTNQRISTNQTMQVTAQQSLRAGTDILTQEFRELSASGGDLLSMDSTSISTRSMGALGFVCALDLSGIPRLDVRSMGKSFSAGDSVLVYVEGVGSAGGDWISGLVSTVVSSTACGSATSAQRITLPGMADTLTVIPVSVGAPVRSFRNFSYSLELIGGDWHLARTTSGGNPELFAGPFLGPNQGGLTFDYLDRLGTPTSVGTDVAQIRITVRARSGPSGGVSDSISSLVYLRN